MKYAIYFIWNDGFKDSDTCNNAKLRDLAIKDMLVRGEFKYIAYSCIYASGEYGKRKVVLDKEGQSNVCNLCK